MDYGYKTINANLLNTGTDADYRKIKEHDISFIIPRDITLYRGIKMLNNDTNKQNIIDNYTGNNNKFIKLESFSLDPDIAMQFTHTRYSDWADENVGKGFDTLNETEGMDHMIVKTRVKAGAKCGVGTDYERELFFDKDTEFHVISHKITAYNNKKFHVVEIELK